jgi:hypothetical protein
VVQAVGHLAVPTSLSGAGAVPVKWPPAPRL